MILLIATGIVFRVTGYLNGAEFVDLLSVTAVAFFSTNAAEHMIKTVGEWLKGKVSG